jgi:phage repressor protein C with HTH and peptisase S24 domain
VVVARHPEHGYVVKRVGRVSSVRVELVSLNADYAPLEIPNDSALVLGTVLLRWCPHRRAVPS